MNAARFIDGTDATGMALVPGFTLSNRSFLYVVVPVASVTKRDRTAEPESCQNLTKSRVKTCKRAPCRVIRGQTRHRLGLMLLRKPGWLCMAMGGCRASEGAVSASDYMLMISSQASRSVTAENLQVV